MRGKAVWWARVLPWGFPARLALATSVLIMVACFALSWILVRRDLEEIRRGVVDRGLTIVEYLAHEAELSVLSGDVESLRALAEAAQLHRDVWYCRFFDRSGQLLLTAGAVPDTLPALTTGDQASGPTPVSAHVWEFQAPVFTADLRLQREELEFAAPPGGFPGAAPARAPERVGTVAVGIALASLQTHRQMSFLTAVFFTALIAFAAVLSAIFLAKAITRPLQALARAADAIGQGDLSVRLDVRTNDEVSAVADSFNEMAVSLAQSRTTLEEYSRSLETRTLRLEVMNRELQEANRLKSEFLTTVSHELRTPLNVILGYTMMLADSAAGPVTEEQHELLGAIHRYTTTQLELIKNVLDFTQLSAGKVALHTQRFTLPPVLAEIAAQHHDALAASGVDLAISVAPDVGELESDAAKVHEILRNLIDNAVKFTGAGSITVEARLGLTKDTVVIEVRDTGAGIPAEELPYVFDGFRQTGDANTRGTQGLGLGLSIAKRLVDALGGTIAVRSVAETGSVFRLELPRRLADGIVPAASVPDPQQAVDGLDVGMGARAQNRT